MTAYARATSISASKPRGEAPTRTNLWVRVAAARLARPESLSTHLIQEMSLRTPLAGLARSQYWIHPALTEVVENALLKLEAQL